MSSGKTSPSLSQHRLLHDLVFLSGQVGWNDDGTVSDNFETQMRLAMGSLRRQLENAGASLQTTLKTTVFITRREDFSTMNAIYIEYFAAPFPARSTVVCDLALPALLFEIEAIASSIPKGVA